MSNAYEENTKTMEISIDQCYKMALLSNPEVINAKRNYNILQLGYKSSLLAWAPRLDPLRQKTLFENDKVYFNGDTGIQWQWPQGGRIGISAGASVISPYIPGTVFSQKPNIVSDILSNTNTYSATNFDYSTVVTLSAEQALLGKARIENNFSVKEIKLLKNQAILEFKKTISKVLHGVSSKFYDIYSMSVQENLTQDDLSFAEKKLKQLQLEIKAGKKPKADYAEQQVQVMQNKLDLMQLRSKLRKEKNILKNLLAIDPSYDIKIKYMHQSIEKTQIPNIKNLIHTSLTHNDELFSQKVSIEKQKHTLAVDKSQAGIQATLAGMITRDDSQDEVNITPSGSLSLEYNLSQSSLNYQKQINNTQYILTRESFLENCKNIKNNLFDEYEDLVFEKSFIQLQEKKLNLDYINLQNIELKYKHGLVSKYVLEEKKSSYLMAKKSFEDKKIKFINNLNQYKINTGMFLKSGNIDLPRDFIYILDSVKYINTAKLGKVNNSSICYVLLQSPLL